MDFEEWSKYNLGYTGEEAYKAGQQSKQAEIDALKQQNQRLAMRLDVIQGALQNK